ncbi:MULTISPECIES: hypothetical protein [unclassified Variovorax]|uniref:hypothetical protein n=1 Tax=unclassified Variovorax TaxID=663243 RepID=UPI0008BA0CE5|nr:MULTISPECIES: hypothetical protein [unclassified Variovorax]SEK07262.1 hypothetical protein SAMN05518853_107294 [Variovorax sp. OK202]SFD49826.1 hypothetical protein SAMN05444746_107294 [Variovorax sp. OK212]
MVLARDGKHTIPYDRLEKARQGEQHWKAQAEEVRRQLADLRAKADARAEAGQAPTKTDNMVAAAEAAIEKGVDASLFGDFSEEALAAGIAKLVQQRVEVRVGKAVAPLQAKQQQDAATAHYDAIYKAHPNADSIVERAQSSRLGWTLTPALLATSTGNCSTSPKGPAGRANLDGFYASPSSAKQFRPVIGSEDAEGKGGGI